MNTCRGFNIKQSITRLARHTIILEELRNEDPTIACLIPNNVIKIVTCLSKKKKEF